MPVGDYLKEVAYPRLDAVDAGLLHSLRPAAQSTAGSYSLLCPACKEKSGFYYPQSGYVQCSRKNNCGVATSVWDVLANTGVRPGDIIKQICAAAGVDLPPKDNDRQGQSRGDNASAPGAAAGPAPISPGKAIFQVTQELARANPNLLEVLREDRGFTQAQMSEMKLGVYTTPAEVLKMLLAKGISREVAIEKGYIEVDSDNPEKLLSGTSNRVVGYWPHPDHDLRLWGRIAKGKGEKTSPKYRFSPSLKKDIPYLFNQRRPTPLILVEGTFDAWSLNLSGYWAGAIGQASINGAQAAFLLSSGVTEVAHMVDGDTAGYEGAVASIRNCESLGIVVSIITLGAGMDDADALRREGKTAQIKALVDSRFNAGEYLANLAVGYMMAPIPDLKAMKRVIAASRVLTPSSRARWADLSASYGIPIYSESESARLFANALDAGLDLGQAIARVAEKTGYLITMKLEEPVDG